MWHKNNFKNLNKEHNIWEKIARNKRTMTKTVAND